MSAQTNRVLALLLLSLNEARVQQPMPVPARVSVRILQGTQAGEKQWREHRRSREVVRQDQDGRKILIRLVEHE